MANSQDNPAFESELYKAFFDDATLSDLTIQLSDRTVQVHRIVLCRKSKYFTKLLTGRFQENGSKEIELKEDDADAMVALLRYLYDLPYDEAFGDQREFLQPYAETYVVAEKYQVRGLKIAISEQLRHMIHSERDLRKEYWDRENQDVDEFIEALETIIDGTPAHDKYARKVMVEACVLNLQRLHQRPEFLSLLRESSDLGADIIGHRDVECGFPGEWVCGNLCEERLKVACSRCKEQVDDLIAIENRDNNVDWECEECGEALWPMCSECEEPVRWYRRGL